MRKRIKFKKRYNYNLNIKKTDILIILFVLISICLFFAIRFIGNKIRPIVNNIAEAEAKKIASIVISNAIPNTLAEKLSFDNLFETSKDNEGNIQSMDYNSVIVNQLLNESIKKIYTNLKYIEKGDIDKVDIEEIKLASYDTEKMKKGVFYEIPLGSIFNSPLISNLGPKIPVKFSLVGEMLANLDSKVTSYGINNALIEVGMHLVITMRVVLPISVHEFEVERNVPFSFKIVQGIVPKYYFGNNSSTSSTLVVPVE